MNVFLYVYVCMYVCIFCTLKESNSKVTRRYTYQTPDDKRLQTLTHVDGTPYSDREVCMCMCVCIYICMHICLCVSHVYVCM